ncbi:transcription regulator [Cryptococcus deuterogattii 99/473]|uniref:Transcription regulator n=2 Tax=Cryptococcus deuterogattii TaxID=1859096 RepID=A0A0D0V3W0_9TREE|nr:transcription regulator [Cryptococcus deuterogattii R265]KIR26388.1 transcription regulator [Cryptococcus deuterogattii LA55]KIR41309.1 transcription regulator [Cryptococcus deuterogattii Ram5]KIR69946.1 transcription regulator [Cryptococcus deuterogattii CA1014]KIR89949.1 transcription regulator [Cryptococcus deuterogattii CBS 10090]KIY56279.1 transcription regulator [Cryptococcus deuterogattii 99/473]
MATLAEHRAFLNFILDRQAERRRLVDPDTVFPTQPVICGRIPRAISHAASYNDEGKGEGRAIKDNVVNYVKEEETIRNDYCEWYGATGECGSSFIMGAEGEDICSEYPALKKLMNLKAQLVSSNSHPPLYVPLSHEPLRDSLLSTFSNLRFDVIRINPSLNWAGIADLPIKQISSDPAVVFLWVGRGDQEGLERGRECFARWGFRRAEDIVWVKTNKNKNSDESAAASGALFANQKEHCLMGIKGTIKRSVDVRFAHCNVDTDIIVWEDSGDPEGPRYPPYLYTLIENFCLGTRRLEIFGRPNLARPGWVTAGLEPFSSSVSTPSRNSVQLFDPQTYTSFIPESDGKPILPFSPEIDQLRPKSPVRKPQRYNNPSGGNPNNLSGGGIGNTGSRNQGGSAVNGRPSPAPRFTQNGGSSGSGTPMGVMPNQPSPIDFSQTQGRMSPVNPMMMQVGPSMEQIMAANIGMGMGGMGTGVNGPMNMMMGMPVGNQYGYGTGINGGQPGFGPPFGAGMGMPMGMGVGMGMGMPMGMDMGMGHMGNMGFDVMMPGQGHMFGQQQQLPQIFGNPQMGPRFGGWHGQGGQGQW